MGFWDLVFGRRETPPEFGLLKPQDKDYLATEWGRVEDLLATKRPSAFKEAVIAADKMLDFALKKVIMGEAMGERLKNSREGFSPEVYQGLWDAHKMRNSLVHEATFDLTTLVARDVLEKYQRGFRSMGVRI